MMPSSFKPNANALPFDTLATGVAGSDGDRCNEPCAIARPIRSDGNRCDEPCAIVRPTRITARMRRQDWRRESPLRSPLTCLADRVVAGVETGGSRRPRLASATPAAQKAGTPTGSPTSATASSATAATATAATATAATRVKAAEFADLVVERAPIILTVAVGHAEADGELWSNSHGG
jgi:hypothetical protein